MAQRITVVSGDLEGSTPLAVPTVSAVNISGTLRVAETLTANATIGGGASTLTYVWKRNGFNITGATAHTYLTVAADLDQDLSVTVFAGNASGSASGTSIEVHIEPTIIIDVEDIGTVDVTITFDTNLIKGQVYYVITESATIPTKEQILAGKDHLGAAAVAANHVNVTALQGVITNAANAALIAATDYWVYATQKRRNTFTSNIAIIDFTTAGGG